MYKKHIVTAVFAVALTTNAASAGNDFVSGMMGAMIGAAIANQGGNSSGASRNSGTSRSSGISSAERSKNKEIQEALNYFGYNVGNPDGVLGSKSRNAISQVQACLNRQISGVLDSFEDQFLRNSHFKAQAAGNQTLRIVASKPNGYCGLLQDYMLELTAPQQPQTVQPAPAPQPQQQTATVVVNNLSTTSNQIYVSIDSDLQTKYDLALTQLKLLEQIQKHIDDKVHDNSSRRKLSTIMNRIGELRELVHSVEVEVKGKYGTPIKPTNANLGVTAVKASEVFPRVPYYIPGTDEIGEMWIKPYVTDAGMLMYDFNFVAGVSEFDKIKDTIQMNSEQMRTTSVALVKVTEWSDVAIEKGMRRRYQKTAACFPEAMCGKNEAGNTSSEVIFMLYEDGSSAARIQQNKGKFRSGYNLSVESGLLLSAYLDYMAEIGEKEFEANTISDEDLDSVFKD